MQRLTIMRTGGDPDRLLAAKREHIDPVMKARGAHYGHLLHVAARTADGLVVVNLWESAEGSEEAARDPELQRAREAMQASGAVTTATELSHYEVVDLRPSPALREAVAM